MFYISKKLTLLYSDSLPNSNKIIHKNTQVNASLNFIEMTEIHRVVF